MPIISTNGPQFLRYLTSTFTRDEIINSPEYCYLLEDPDIKDDVEIAFKYDEALKGGYEEKKEFIQYLLCNGPELDPHTIFYYRDIILNNNELYDIYRYEFSYNTADIQMNLREATYKKATSRSGKKSCFDDPGTYLGPFNVTLSMGVNARDWQNPKNVYAEIAKYRNSQQYSEKREEETPIKPDEIPANDRGTKDLTPQAQFGVTSMRVANTVAAKKNIKNDTDGVADIKANSCGDATAIKTAKDLEDALTLKLFNTTEDARMFYFSKNYSDFDPKTNKKIPLSSTISYKYPFNIRKKENIEVIPQMMMPGTSGTPGGFQAVYFDTSDRSFISMFEPEGSCILHGPTDGDYTCYTNLGNSDLRRREGKDYAGLIFCPGDKVNIEPSGLFTCGIFADIETLANNHLKMAYQDESYISSENYKKLLRNGLIWRKCKNISW